VALNVPIQAPIFTKADLDDPNLPLLNQYLQEISQRLNYLSGHAGPIKLASSLDMGGNPIQNAGVPSGPNDVVNIEYALQNYGAAAVAPQLEATGKQILQSTRRLNDRNQRETNSSFLNGVLGVAPTSNTSTIVPGSPSSGFVPVTVTGGFHQFVDGSQIPYSAYNDSLAIPSNFPISSLSRSGGVVTGTTSGANTLSAGDTVSIAGAGDPSFDGQFILVAPTSSPTFTYNQPTLGNASTTGGTISIYGVYYYSRKGNSNVLYRSGPYAVDSWTNRLTFNNGTNPSLDGSTLIAVVVVNSSGIDTVNSGGGATPPATGAGVRLFGRL
jgi:hypothetical protein